MLRLERGIKIMWMDLKLELIMPTEQQMKKRKMLPENRISIMTRRSDMLLCNLEIGY